MLVETLQCTVPVCDLKIYFASSERKTFRNTVYAFVIPFCLLEKYINGDEIIVAVSSNIEGEFELVVACCLIQTIQGLSYCHVSELHAHSCFSGLWDKAL